MRFFIPRFLGAVLYFAVWTVVGAAGYALIEGWGLHDALYMTVITLTAVGYQEVGPLSRAGRDFTMVLLAGGITGMGIWFALLTALIVELDLKNVLRRRRIMRDIGKVEDHVVVCGGGRTGIQLIQELIALGQPYVLIERDPERVEHFQQMIPEGLVLQGDATSDHNLEQARIDRARGLATCLSQDTDNLFVCLSARDLNPKLQIVARAYQEETMDKLYRAGADHVVSPNVSSAIRMASVMLRPSVVSFLDVATRSAEMDLRLEQEQIGEDSQLAGQTLQDARIPQETGLIVIAVRKRHDQGPEFVFNPVGTTRLDVGDEMIVLGSPDQIRKLRDHARS